MTVSIMLITHQEVGDAMINVIHTTLGELSLPTTVVSIDYDSDPDDLIPRLERAATQLECGEGLLILTDLYGSTPGNIATRLGNQAGVRVVSGLNLSMLLRLMNYAHLNVDELAAKAISGGIDGVKQCESSDVETKS